MMSFHKTLLTGIPRSGTTLCCKLLNDRSDVIALHEPINPSDLPGSIAGQPAVANISLQIDSFANAIQAGLPFPHGDKGGLQIENPVGDANQSGVRQVVAKRGMIQLPPRMVGSYQLVIKQNALFTALLPLLKERYPIVCIVRNPIDVLLSWMTVDLPVNRGRLPAGERFSAELRESLKYKECLQRQLIIYQWFIRQFLTSGLPVIRYEDVVASGGAELDKALGLAPIERDKLHAKERSFDKPTLAKLELALPMLLEFELGGLYTKQDIQLSFDRVTEHS
jgi:hypothetical protein